MVEMERRDGGDGRMSGEVVWFGKRPEASDDFWTSNFVGHETCKSLCKSS